MKFARENLSAFRGEMTLLTNHWQEIAKDKEVMQLNPDWDYYEQRDRTGQVLFVTAREGAELVGYFIWWVDPHPHYKHLLTAHSDIYFLTPEYRNAGLGSELFRAAIGFAKEAGCGYCFITTKVGHDHPDLMERLGLKPRDLVYGGPI